MGSWSAFQPIWVRKTGLQKRRNINHVIEESCCCYLSPCVLLSFGIQTDHILRFNHNLTRLIFRHGRWGLNNSRVTGFEIRGSGFSFSVAFRTFRTTDVVTFTERFRSVMPLKKKNSGLSDLATVAAYAMFIWDYILTFRMEVDLVWESKWAFTKGLYFFQRYLPFIDTIWLSFYCQFDDFSTILPDYFFAVQMGEGLTETACRNLYYATGGS